MGKLIIIGILILTIVFVWDFCKLGPNPTVKAFQDCASTTWHRFF